MKGNVKISAEGSSNNLVQVKNEETVSANGDTVSKLEILITGGSSIHLTIGNEASKQTASVVHATEVASDAVPAAQPLTEQPSTAIVGQPADVVKQPAPEAVKPTEKVEQTQAEKHQALYEKAKDLSKQSNDLVQTIEQDNAKHENALTQPVAQKPLVNEGEQENWKKEYHSETIQHQESEKDPWYKNPNFWKIFLLILGILLLLWLLFRNGAFDKRSSEEKLSDRTTEAQTPRQGYLPPVQKDTVYNLSACIENAARIHTDYIVSDVKVLDGLKYEHLKPLLSTFHKGHKKLPLEKNMRIRSQTVYSNENEYEYEFFFYPDGKGDLRIVHLPTGEENIFANYRWKKK